MKKYAIILIVVSVILILALAIGLSVGLRKNDKKNKVASASNACAGDLNCFVVTVAGGVFHIDGAASSDGAITLTRGVTYTFDQSDSSNAGHQMILKDIFNAQWTTGVQTNGTAGQSDASVVFSVGLTGFPNVLKYSCDVHGDNMGAQFNIVD